MYARGEGSGGVDDAAANLWYERAVSAGDPQAMLVLGTRLCVGKAGEDEAKGEEEQGEEGEGGEDEAESGGVLDLDTDRQAKASREQEQGVRRRWLRGFPLHLQAAELGLPKAQYNVACHYFTGRFPRESGVGTGDGAGARAGGNEGGDPDYASAADWFERAADAGLPAAMINLANMHAQGLLLGEAAGDDAREEERERARALYARVLGIPEGRAEGEKKHAAAALAAISQNDSLQQ